MESKAQVRAEVRARVRGTDPDARRAADAAITQALLQLLPAVGTRPWCIAAYAALPSEVQTDAFLRAVCHRYGRVALPVYGPDGSPALAVCTDLDRLVVGEHGVRMPGAPRTYVAPGAVDIIVLPGVAFDPTGVRLGRGAGFYDRLLAAVPGRRIGVAYEAQLVQRLPVEPHDARVDHVVTERRIYTARGWRFDSYDAPC